MSVAVVGSSAFSSLLCHNLSRWLGMWTGSPTNMCSFEKLPIFSSVDLTLKFYFINCFVVEVFFNPRKRSCITSLKRAKREGNKRELNVLKKIHYLQADGCRISSSAGRETSPLLRSWDNTWVKSACPVVLQKAMMWLSSGLFHSSDLKPNTNYIGELPDHT